MANTYVKATQVVSQMLGVLERELVLANLVWKDPIRDFRGAKDDTVTLKLPAYTVARERVMRSNTPIVVDNLAETGVDVKLDTHVYKAIGVTDEEMTLDIDDFGQQVTAPAMDSVVRRIEDNLAAKMETSTYATSLTINTTDPWRTLLSARAALNKANVPFSGRFLAVGTDVEEYLLASDRLSKVDQAGDNTALREATIGRIAGFTAVTVPGIDPDVMIASHKTAFALCTAVPVVPAGVSWGERRTYGGFTLRALRDYDPTPAAGGPPQERLLTDTFMGIGVTKDRGTIDSEGRFVPSQTGAESPVLIRAVKMTLPGS